MASTVYLDWNASAPVSAEAREAALRWMEQPGNPSSIHGSGRRARALVEDARTQVALLAGNGRAGAVKPGQVVFTSGGTEALALALHGLFPARQLAEAPPLLTARRCLVSAVEHPAVLAAAHAAGGAPAEQSPVLPSGLIDLPWLEQRLDPQRDDLPQVVAVQLANNETGVIQPMAQIADLVHRAGALLLCDAVQAAGKIPLDLNALGADALALSAHKLGGLPGCGALVLGAGIGVRPLLAGGGQERGQRGGTQNGVGIAAFGAAAAQALALLADGAGEQMAERRDRMQAALLARAPQAVVHGGEVERLPNTLSISLPGVDQQRQVMALDLAGIAVSAGSACSSGKLEPSHVLLAMGMGETLARQAIRVSFGHSTAQDDLDRFVACWSGLVPPQA